MKIEIDGAAEISAALRELRDPKTVRAALRAALRAAARPMLDAARSNVPVDQGDLQRSLKMAAARGEKLDEPQFGIVIGIDINEQPATYVVRKTNSGGRSKGSGKGGFYRDPGVAGVGPMIEFGWPGRPARPFMRRALDAEGEATIRRFGDVAGPVIERFAERLAKRRGRA